MSNSRTDQGDRVEPAFDQERREIGIVAWRLSAEADLNCQAPGLLNALRALARAAGSFPAP